MAGGQPPFRGPASRPAPRRARVPSPRPFPAAPLERRRLDLARVTYVGRGPELREADADGFRAELDVLVSIYASAMNAPPLTLPGRRATMEHHAGLAAFRAILVSFPAAPPTPGTPGSLAGPHLPDAPARPQVPGRRGDRIIAFAYGFHGAPGQWWHDLVARALATAAGEETAAAWMADTFEVAEVHVHPGHQHQGIGRRMLLRLLDTRPEATALLSTMDAETTARRLYRSLGFTDLVTGYRFGGTDPPYAVMGAPLPLGPGSGPAG